MPSSKQTVEERLATRADGLARSCGGCPNDHGLSRARAARGCAPPGSAGFEHALTGIARESGRRRWRSPWPPAAQPGALRGGNLCGGSEGLIGLVPALHLRGQIRPGLWRRSVDVHLQRVPANVLHELRYLQLVVQVLCRHGVRDPHRCHRFDVVWVGDE